MAFVADGDTPENTLAPASFAAEAGGDVDVRCRDDIAGTKSTSSGMSGIHRRLPCRSESGVNTRSRKSGRFGASRPNTRMSGRGAHGLYPQRRGSVATVPQHAICHILCGASVQPTGFGVRTILLREVTLAFGAPQGRPSQRAAPRRQPVPKDGYLVIWLLAGPPRRRAKVRMKK